MAQNPNDQPTKKHIKFTEKFFFVNISSDYMLFYHVKNYPCYILDIKLNQSNYVKKYIFAFYIFLQI